MPHAVLRSAAGPAADRSGQAFSVARSGPGKDVGIARRSTPLSRRLSGSSFRGIDNRSWGESAISLWLQPLLSQLMMPSLPESKACCWPELL